MIIAKGNHIQHYLNNRLILDFTDNDPQLALREGVLALQLHAGQTDVGGVQEHPHQGDRITSAAAIRQL